MFSINPNSGEPIYRQLTEQIKRMVAGGQLKTGDELPSVRELAAQYAVNPMTISKAYSLLEAEGVLAHEVSHVANGDMVTLTLIQGVVNTFVIFFARIVAGFIDNFFRSSDEEESQGGGLSYMITVFVLEMIFGVLASIIVMWFSRQREYKADAGAARLVGANNMVAALQRLKGNHESQLQGSMTAFGLATKPAASELFMSHPPLDKRIHALQSRSFEG